MEPQEVRARPRSGPAAEAEKVQMWDGSVLDRTGSFLVPGKRMPLGGASGSLQASPSGRLNVPGSPLRVPGGPQEPASTGDVEHAGTAAAGDVPVADKSERRGFFAYDFGNGPLGAALIIFTPLLVVGQAQYRASTNSEFIEWRETTIDGNLCVNKTAEALNATAATETEAAGAPYLRDGPHPFKRPVGYDEKCQWFPVNKEVPGTGFDYTSLGVFALSITSIVTAVVLIFFGALGDYGNLRRRTTRACGTSGSFSEAAAQWSGTTRTARSTTATSLCSLARTRTSSRCSAGPSPPPRRTARWSSSPRRSRGGSRSPVARAS